jgi:hypothetical protein
MGLSIRNIMDAPIHMHIGYNPRELVFKIRYAQKDNSMERIGPQIQSHINILT